MSTTRTVNGLAVFEQGDPAAPTVLLVHGYPDTHRVWDAVADRLGERFHVVTYDVRGAGESIRPSGRDAYAFEALMADMAAVLDAVAPGRKVHLVGHDWGSIQSWEAVCTMGERFASFTSMSGPCLDHVAEWTRGRLGRPTPRNLRRAAGQGIRSWYIYAFQTPVLPELAWRSGLLRRLGDARDGAAGVGLYRANMLERLRRPRPRRTDVPTQVIVATRDAFVSPHLVGGLQEKVPNLRIRGLKAGHWLPRTHPELVARWITEHIDGRPERTIRRATVGPDRRPFEGHLVVVTGAGSGIGRATALAFAEQGAEVVAADLDLPSARRTAHLCGLVGPAGQAYEVDVADAGAMAGFAKTVHDEHGVADVLVNNAGIGIAGSFFDHTVEDWQRLLDVNLWGVIQGCRLFGAQMAERGEGGHIVNTASAAAYTPSRMLPAYSTSKAAVLMLSECLRAELAGKGIGVTAICPGLVNTNITRTSRFVGRTDAQQERDRRRVVRAYGLRGYGPERVAAQILTAVRQDRAVVPVTAEARLGLLAARFAPGLLRRLAKVDMGR